MPYEIQAKGTFNEISNWLWDNVGKPVESHDKYTHERNWQVLPIGLTDNTWTIRLWDHNKVVLTKLRWE